MPQSAIVLGSASGCWEEFRAARDLIGEDHIVIACNHAFRDAPFDVAHVATMHPDLLPLWIGERAEKGYPPAGRFWHARHRIVPAGIASTAIESWGGSSGLLCVAVAFELGIERIVLAGVPMLPNARHYDIDRRWDEARAYHRAWEARRDLMLGRVKSMSGWTRDLLGSPDEGDWLAGSDRSASRAP